MLIYGWFDDNQKSVICDNQQQANHEPAMTFLAVHNTK